MEISARDYQQWFNTYWVPVGEHVRKLTDSLGKLSASIDYFDVPGFVEAVDEMGPGIPKQNDDACRVIADAKDKLEQLHTNEQRIVASGSANAIIDKAIQSRDQLFSDLERLRLKLIPDTRSTYYSLLDEMKGTFDEEHIGGKALSGLDGLSGWRYRLDEANKDITDSLKDADSAAQAIIGIPDEDLTIGRPTAAAPSRTSTSVKTSMTRDRVDSTVVDNWNEQALKMLKEDSETVFYEIGDLVIIDAKQPTVQPYLDWAKEQPEVNPAAKITMTKKGGAFDSGKIKAEGVSNRSSFEAAIKRVSKKKVEY